ncbi:MAG: protein-L-isoaspartate(D-aspartate) O-methyltransferase [Thermodesulfobacteriota bacterium]
MRALLPAVLALVLFFPPDGVRAGDDGYVKARLAMVAEQIEARGISDPAVLAAMRKVPRHEFVPAWTILSAYHDRPLPIGQGQTISQPYVVAFMTEILKLTGRENVLEIGTGSGYQAAILAETAAEVCSIEIIPELLEEARARLDRLGYGAVKLKTGDGYYGWEEYAPFDGIVVTCAADHIPPPLIKQLKPGGRMVIPVGPAWSVQTLVLGLKEADGVFKREALFPVAFVPLVRSAD